MASSLAGVAGVTIISYLYYPMVLAGVCILAILIGEPKARKTAV